MTELFPPTRARALERLDAFLPRAGREYARTRNFDFGPARRDNISMLSPYLRHRVISEDEVARAVLARHSLSAAEKFIQEVCWRTYWKGWLEQHPEVWANYLAACARDRAAVADDADLAAFLVRAETGATGIDCYDAWVSELIETGYLHNHARMWFASIWIFTLRLPWTLGADFFYRHLLDGDPASNTLSWRWVAGLHTRGKTYLARADNIATYTGGRFSRSGQLAAHATALDDDDAPTERRVLLPAAPLPKTGPVALLVTGVDLHPESWGVRTQHVAAIGLLTEPGDLHVSPLVRAFRTRTLREAGERAQRYFAVPVRSLDRSATGAWHDELKAAGCGDVVSMRPPVGPGLACWQDLVEDLGRLGVTVHAVRRPWDALFWPHAKAGFFQLKDRIPSVFGKLGIAERPRHPDTDPPDPAEGRP